MVALGFLNLQSGKITYICAPMPLQPAPSCSKHQNHLGMTLLEPKLVKICKIYASFNFSLGISSKTRKTPVKFAICGSGAEISRPAKLATKLISGLINLKWTLTTSLELSAQLTRSYPLINSYVTTN